MWKRRADIILILSILLMLVLIQASRAGLLSLMGALNPSAYTYSDFLLILIGVILYFLVKPGKQLLGLNFDNTKKRDKIIYTAGTAVILLLFISSMLYFCRSREDRILELAAVLIFPAFEELLFRGYLWD
jgi:membrane protease YdiL (CAAX protease family)